MKGLFILGKFLKSDSRAIAVVGSRKMSKRGELITQGFVKELVKKGITIISGLARGVDTVAHKTALGEGGRTIAVLGCGLDIIYPPENENLAKKIIAKGALVSPFAKGTRPRPKNFLGRNRVIAKLSLAVLVIEGERRSGVLSTAGWAAQEGVEVFAVPGSPATDWLISQGAGVATSPKDVLDYISKITK